MAVFTISRCSLFSGKVKLEIKPKELAAKFEAKLKASGGPQELFTNRIMKDADPFVPMDTGTLAGSAIRASEKDRIIYNMPYAKRLYYGIKFKFSRDKHPQATHHWIEAAAARHKEAWGRYLAQLLQGKWKRQ